MRSEQTMFALIRAFAGQDERIRAAYLNGSRANPNAPKDIMQDYDIVCAVTDVPSFTTDKAWIARFGDIIVMQEPDGPLFRAVPETNAYFTPDENGNPAEKYTFLMLFNDGNRIDLTFQSIPYTRKEYGRDPLTVPLLDKDDLLRPLPAPSDRSRHIRKPRLTEYARCTNEFWWVSTYVAKGLWRGEMLYAMDHLNGCVRPMLVDMLTWRAGVAAGFAVSAGKHGKYLHAYLPSDLWRRFLGTYPPAESNAMWDALFGMADLFDDISREVGEALGYCPDQEQAQRTRAYLERVRNNDLA